MTMLVAATGGSAEFGAENSRVATAELPPGAWRVEAARAEEPAFACDQQVTLPEDR